MRKSQRQIELDQMVDAAKENAEFLRLEAMDKAEADHYRNEEKLTGLEEHLRDSQVSSASECSEYDARIAGRNRPNQAWILSGFDVWHRNPYYAGPPVPHPEDYPEAEGAL